MLSAMVLAGALMGDCAGGVCTAADVPRVQRSVLVRHTVLVDDQATAVVVGRAPVRRLVAAPVRFFHNHKPVRRAVRWLFVGPRRVACCD